MEVKCDPGMCTSWNPTALLQRCQPVKHHKKLYQCSELVSCLGVIAQPCCRWWSPRKKAWFFFFFLSMKQLLKWENEAVSQLASGYFEPSQPQRITSWLQTMFNLSAVYSARKSSNHKLSKNHKISPDTNSHKTKHTQMSNTKMFKN